jgi:hypothetical protein
MHELAQLVGIELPQFLGNIGKNPEEEQKQIEE